MQLWVLFVVGVIYVGVKWAEISERKEYERRRIKQNRRRLRAELAANTYQQMLLLPAARQLTEKEMEMMIVRLQQEVHR